MSEPANKTSIPRIRSVTFKNGGATIRVLNPQINENRGHVEARVRETIDLHVADTKEIAGFAFVIWDNEGRSVCDACSTVGSIPPILVPDFVRNRLLAERIEEWTAFSYGLARSDG